MGRVRVNPEMLKWAREDAGYTYSNLPNNLLSNVKKWESGEVMPTWKQLCDLSNQYKRPSALFFRKNPPVSILDSINLMEYRKIDTDNEVKTPQLTLGIRDALNKRNIFLELMEDMNYPKISFSKFKYNSDNIEEFSSKIRELIGVNLEEQKNWYNDTEHYSFLNQWKEKVSDLGVLIFEVSRVDVMEMRALCVYFDEYPIILLNGGDSPNARIFSLFHELTHLLSGQSAICDLDNDNSKESFCNAVAAGFLVPSDDLLDDDISNHSKFWEEKELKSFSNIYGVSEETILLRLLSLNKTTNNFYISKKEEWNYNFKNNKNNKSSGGNPVLNQIKYNGKLYSRLIFTAYQNNIISASDFSSDMGLRLKHTANLEYYLFR